MTLRFDDIIKRRRHVKSKVLLFTNQSYQENLGNIFSGMTTEFRKKKVIFYNIFGSIFLVFQY